MFSCMKKMIAYILAVVMIIGSMPVIGVYASDGDYTADEIMEALKDNMANIRSFNKYHKAWFDVNIMSVDDDNNLTIQDSALELLEEAEVKYDKPGYKDKIESLVGDINNLADESEKSQIIAYMNKYRILDKEMASEESEEQNSTPAPTPTEAPLVSQPPTPSPPTPTQPPVAQELDFNKLLSDILGLAGAVSGSPAVSKEQSSKKVIETMEKVSALPGSSLVVMEKEGALSVSVDEGAFNNKVNEIMSTADKLAKELLDMNQPELIAAIDKEVEIRIPQEERHRDKEFILNMTPASVKKAVEEKISLNILSYNIDLQMPITNVQSDLAKGISFRSKPLESTMAQELVSRNTSGMKLVGNVYDLTLTTTSDSKESSSQIGQFKEKVRLSFAFDSKKVNKNALGVYYYDEKVKAWKYVGGKVDKASDKITVETSHFSKYAVFEYNRTFTDINSTWAKDTIEHMASRHVFTVQDGQTFRPSEKITRQDFAVWLVRAMNISELAAESSFKDVSKASPYYKEISIASKEGLILGSEGNFSPERLITRQEMAVMMARALKYMKLDQKEFEGTEITAGQNDFSDAKSIAQWAKDSAELTYRYGIITGREKKSFAPLENAQRAEAITMLKRLIDLQ